MTGTTVAIIAKWNKRKELDFLSYRNFVDHLPPLSALPQHRIYKAKNVRELPAQTLNMTFHHKHSQVRVG